MKSQKTNIKLISDVPFSVSLGTLYAKKLSEVPHFRLPEKGLQYFDYFDCLSDNKYP
jgi:hypothetical protein